MNDLHIHPEEMAFTISAPGKVILFGEHSVVYGKRALALSIGLRNDLYIDTAQEKSVVIELPDIKLFLCWRISELERLYEKLNRGQMIERGPFSMTDIEKTEYEEFLKANNTDGNTGYENNVCLYAILHLYTCILPQPVPFLMRGISLIPIGAGLGSSAAFGACLSGALLKLSKKHPFKHPIERMVVDEVRRWSFISEQIFHGTPSGIDNAVCCFGGGISFKNGNITPIQVPTLKVMLINTGISRSTKALVSSVRKKYEAYPSLFGPVLTSMDNLAELGISFLLKEELVDEHDTQLNTLIDTNHALLRVLDVSHPKLEEIVSIAKRFGFSAKLTGAGGGGFAIVVDTKAGEDLAACAESLKESGFEVWETNLGVEGVTFIRE